MKTTVFYRLPVMAYCGFIFWQSSSASFDSMPTFEYADKVMHLGGYALLGALVVRMLFNESLPFSRGNLMIAAIFFSTLYGVSDEIHQTFVADRCGDVLDGVADGLGSALGVIGFVGVRAWFREQRI